MKRCAAGGDNFTLDLNNRRATGSGDGSTIEQLAKPRRGRPLGSKNKLKPPVVITCDPSPKSAFRTHVLEIPSGRDAAKAIAAFAGGLGDGVCVLAGYGSVSSATIRQPSQSPAAVIFHGRFDLLSLSAVFLPGSRGSGSSMTASLAGPQGQIMGVVAGPLIAAGTVVVVAAAFTEPEFHRLPEEEGEATGSCSGSLSGGGEAAGEKQEERHRLYFQGIHMMANDEGEAGVFGGVPQFGDD